MITNTDYSRLKLPNSYIDVGIGHVFSFQSLSPLENVKTDITNRLKNFAMSTLCPRVNPLEGVSRACVAIGERLLKDVAFNRFVQGLAGWVLRHVFERPTTDAMEARRACLGAATFRKLSHMRYEAKELFVKWAAQAVTLYRKKLSWKDIRSFLDTMYVYARWAFSTCDALLDDFVRMMSQLLRTSASVANDPFMSAPDKPARLRALGQEILQKWALALWKGALKNANHRVPEHRSGSFRQSLLESKIRAERVKDWPEPVHELDLYYYDEDELSDIEEEE